MQMGRNGTQNLSLNLSVPTFQLISGEQIGAAANPGQADLGRLPVTGPMSAQQYEVLLDPNYVADRQWETAEMMGQIEQLQAEQIRGQQVSRGTAQTVQVNSTAIGPLNDDARHLD